MGNFEAVLKKVRSCRLCEKHLPLGANPIIWLDPAASVLLISQAPGTKVHKTCLPFNDPSGDLLRIWLNTDRDTFYNSKILNFMPMGFCYPGKAERGDLPPRPECAPAWHKKLMALLPNLKIKILIGSHAIHHYIPESRKTTLVETIKNWRKHAPQFLVFPHPSPRNRMWLKENPWFESEVIPKYRKILRQYFNSR